MITALPKRNKLLKHILVGVAIALTVLVAIDVCMSFLVTDFTLGTSDPAPHSSVQASRNSGLFLGSLSAEPRELNFDGKRIPIKGAWLEKVAKVKAVIVIIPCLYSHVVYSQESRIYVCLLLESGGEAKLEPTMWWKKDSGKSLGQHVHEGLYWFSIDKEEPDYELMIRDEGPRHGTFRTDITLKKPTD